MARARLDNKAKKAAVAKRQRAELWDPGCEGLHVIITPAGRQRSQFDGPRVPDDWRELLQRRNSECTDAGREGNMGNCNHPTIIVDYDHPHSTIEGVTVSDLRRSPAAKTRPIMTLRNPRCASCGAPFTRSTLGARIRPGGDCFDKRFRWT